MNTSEATTIDLTDRAAEAMEAFRAKGQEVVVHDADCRCTACIAGQLVAADDVAYLNDQGVADLSAFLSALTEITRKTTWQAADMLVQHGDDGAIVRVHWDGQQKRYVAEIR